MNEFDWKQQAGFIKLRKTANINPENMKQDKNLPLVVFDLDDTLAMIGERANILKQDFPTEAEKWDTFFDACDQDEPNRAVMATLDAFLTSIPRIVRVEIWTARIETVRVKTEAWLEDNMVWYPPDIPIPLRMRAEGDFRNDTEIKGEWIQQYGKPWFVFDDRNKVVEWWREQGITCFQVKDSDF